MSRLNHSSPKHDKRRQLMNISGDSTETMVQLPVSSDRYMGISGNLCESAHCFCIHKYTSHVNIAHPTATYHPQYIHHPV